MDKRIGCFLLVVLFLAGCQKTADEAATYTPMETVTSAPTETLYPSTTIEPVSEPDDEHVSAYTPDMSTPKEDVTDIMCGDYIKHADNTYDYKIQYPVRWQQTLQYKRYGSGEDSWLELVFDFDGYDKFENAITLTSTKFQYDFRIFNERADDVMLGFDDCCIRIYTIENTGSTINFNFRIDNNNYFYGNIKMNRSFYDDNEQEIMEFLKNIQLVEANDSREYITFKDDNTGYEITYPAEYDRIIEPEQYGENEWVIRFILNFNEPSEYCENIVRIIINPDTERNNDNFIYKTVNSINYDEIDLIYGFYDKYRLIYEDVFIEDINTYVRFELERVFFEKYRDDIINIIKSIKLTEDNKQETILESPAIAEKITYIDENSGLKVTYPGEWQQNTMYYASGLYSGIILYIGTDVEDDDYNKLTIGTNDNFEYVPWGEFSEYTELETENGTLLYFEQPLDEIDDSLIQICFNIDRYENYMGNFILDYLIYEQYKEDILEVLSSIEIVDVPGKYQDIIYTEQKRIPDTDD